MSTGQEGPTLTDGALGRVVLAGVVLVSLAVQVAVALVAWWLLG